MKVRGYIKGTCRKIHVNKKYVKGIELGTLKWLHVVSDFLSQVCSVLEPILKICIGIRSYLQNLNTFSFQMQSHPTKHALSNYED